MDDLRKSSFSNNSQTKSIYALTRDIISKNGVAVTNSKDAELEEYNLQVIRENDGDLTSFFKKDKDRENDK